jgi:ABC-2 type transport system ATP-binding protein
MNANQFFDFIIKYRKTKTAPRLNELIKLFELNSHVKIKKMSKGMKQKVAIITAFMHDPEILILDEPTSGLDPLMQAKFIDLIMAEKKRKKTIIISSHMFDEVEKTCDRICIIKSGKIVALDTAANLHKKYVKPYIVTLANTQLAKSFAKDFNGILHGTKVTVSTKQTLEEIFLNFYKKENNEPDSI